MIIRLIASILVWLKGLIDPDEPIPHPPPDYDTPTVKGDEK